MSPQNSHSTEKKFFGQARKGRKARIQIRHTLRRQILTQKRCCASIVSMLETQTQHATARRSTRVFIRIRVRAEGKTNAGRKFRETCETIVINVQGALLYLEHEVTSGTTLIVTNPLTQEEQECRVVFLGDAGDKGQRVGVEFLSPSPHFWGVDFQGVCRITPSEPPQPN